MPTKIVYELHNIRTGLDLYSFFFTDEHFIALCARRASRAAAFASNVGWSFFPIGGFVGGAIQGATKGVTGQIGGKNRQEKQKAKIDNFRARLQHEDPEQLIKDKSLKGSFFCNYKSMQFETVFPIKRKKKPVLVIQCNNYHIEAVNWDGATVEKAASILSQYGAQQAQKLKPGLFATRVMKAYR